MKKTLIGEIVSVKQQGTATVRIVRKIVHPLYKKVLTVSKKLSVDTKGFSPVLKDIVKIVEGKRMSKNKTFKIMEVIKHGTA